MNLELDEINFTDEDGLLRGHVQIYGTMHHIILLAVAWETGSEYATPKVRQHENDINMDYHIQVAANSEYEFILMAHRMTDDSTGHFETIWHEGIEYVLFLQPQVS